MVELGLIDLETGKSEYDSYIRNGMMLVRRWNEALTSRAHMRNRRGQPLVLERAQESGAIVGARRQDIPRHQGLRLALIVRRTVAGSSASSHRVITKRPRPWWKGMASKWTSD